MEIHMPVFCCVFREAKPIKAAVVTRGLATDPISNDNIIAFMVLSDFCHFPFQPSVTNIPGLFISARYLALLQCSSQAI